MALPVPPLLLPMEAVVLPLIVDATIVFRAARDAKEHVTPAVWMAEEQRLRFAVPVPLNRFACES